MRFRPCIDLHEGKVKQIIGETLDRSEQAVVENFVSDEEPAYYAKMFAEDHLLGGHVIMLGQGNEQAAIQALQAYPGGLQIGGGITAENAAIYLEQGATHVIVTSYIFQKGQLNMRNLDRIISEIGSEKLVIDLSCKQIGDEWKVATDRWTMISDVEVNQKNIKELERYCDEFLIHAVDVEGKKEGFQEQLVQFLAESVSIPTTYAGGIRTLDDLDLFYDLSSGKLDITVGSALDIFGGQLPYRAVVNKLS